MGIRRGSVGRRVRRNAPGTIRTPNVCNARRGCPICIPPVIRLAGSSSCRGRYGCGPVRARNFEVRRKFAVRRKRREAVEPDFRYGFPVCENRAGSERIRERLVGSGKHASARSPADSGSGVPGKPFGARELARSRSLRIRPGRGTRRTVGYGSSLRVRSVERRSGTGIEDAGIFRSRDVVRVAGYRFGRIGVRSERARRGHAEPSAASRFVFGSRMGFPAFEFRKGISRGGGRRALRGGSHDRPVNERSGRGFRVGGIFYESGYRASAGVFSWKISRYRGLRFVDSRDLGEASDPGFRSGIVGEVARPYEQVIGIRRIGGGGPDRVSNGR